MADEPVTQKSIVVCEYTQDPAHTEDITCCTTTPEFRLPSGDVVKFLITGSRDYFLKIWVIGNPSPILAMPHVHGLTTPICIATETTGLVDVGQSLRVITSSLVECTSSIPSVKIWKLRAISLSEVTMDIEHGMCSEVNTKWVGIHPRNRDMFVASSVDVTIWSIQNTPVTYCIKSKNDVFKRLDWCDPHDRQACFYAGSFSNDGTYLVMPAGRIVYVINVATRSVVHKMAAGNGFVYKCCFDPTNTLITSLSHDRTVRMWSFDPAALMGPLDPKVAVEAIVAEPMVEFKLDNVPRSCQFVYVRDTLCVFTVAGKTIQLWDIVAQKCIWVNSETHREPVMTSALINENILVTAGVDRQLVVWHIH